MFRFDSGVSYFNSMELKLANLNLVVTGYRSGDFISDAFWNGFE